jgi:hypothetical protein
VITLLKKNAPSEKNSKKRKNLGEEISKEFVDSEELQTDPLGSWTGTPADCDDIPTQDADDL